MSLKPDLKKTVLDVLAKNGNPPLIDKTFNSIWETFAKTQPSVLNTSVSAENSDVWGNLERSLTKYGVDPKYAKQTVTRLQKKFGESPSTNEIKAFMS